MKLEKEKIINFLLKFPWIVAKHAFFACLVIFFLALFLGILLFYKCDIASETAYFENGGETFLLNYQSYQYVLKQWKEGEKKFMGTDYREYKNPFEKGLTEEEI